MKLSTRNQLAGTVTEVVHGSVMSTVKVELRGGDIITASITLEAAQERGLPVGDLLASLTDDFIFPAANVYATTNLTGIAVMNNSFVFAGILE
jgi:molybdopterin-binding protein